MKQYFDLKLLKILGLGYALISLISFCKNCYLKLNGYRFQNWNWDTLIVNAHLYDWLYVMAFMTIIAVTTKIMIERKIKWGYIMVIHFFLSFFIGIFVFVLSTLTAILIGTAQLNSASFDFNLTRYFSVLDLNFLVYFSLVSIIYSYYYFNEKKKSEFQKLQIESQLNNAKMSILKSQLRPHFLFNTLNSIHSLMNANTDKSQEMLVDLSDLLRELIEHKDENLITLEDELFFLNKYLSIEKKRFSDDLIIDLQVEPNLVSAQIPSMILQPIVENSIKHGYSKKHLTLSISIKIYKKDHFLYIEISNNGNPLNRSLDKNINSGLGINNTMERLKTLYQENYTFKICNSEYGVTTEIKIPYQVAEYKLVSTN